MNSGDSATTAIAEPRATLRAWGICGLMLLATMLNYMDRQALAQQATEISRELKLSNEDYGRLEAGFGLAFAVGGIVTGLIADRISPRWLYPAVLLGWSAVGFATGWVTSYRELLVCRVLLGFFEAGQWPCALVTSQRLLSRRDRPLGNSILQSGASLGAIATPIVVLLLTTTRRKLAAAVPRHRRGRRVLGRRLAGRRSDREDLASRPVPRHGPRGPKCPAAGTFGSTAEPCSSAGSWPWRSS